MAGIREPVSSSTRFIKKKEFVTPVSFEAPLYCVINL